MRTGRGLEEDMGWHWEADKETSANPWKAGSGLCADLVTVSFPGLSRCVCSFLEWISQLKVSEISWASSSASVSTRASEWTRDTVHLSFCLLYYQLTKELSF